MVHSEMPKKIQALIEKYRCKAANADEGYQSTGNSRYLKTMHDAEDMIEILEAALLNSEAARAVDVIAYWRMNLSNYDFMNEVNKRAAIEEIIGEIRSFGISKPGRKE